MGEEGDDTSTNGGAEERTEKKYCCGNCPQRESINIARIDLGVAIYEIIFILAFAIIYFVIPDYFQNYVVKEPKQKFLVEFLALPETVKLAWLSLNIIIPIFSVVLAVLLLIAAKAKNVVRLKLWFKLTVMKTLPALALDTYSVITFWDDRNYIIAFVLFCYCYRLYSLWICLELNKEIQTVDTDFIHPMYRDNP